MNCFKYTNNFHLSDRLVVENIKNVFFEFIEVYNHDIHIMGMEDGGNSENVKIKNTRF